MAQVAEFRNHSGSPIRCVLKGFRLLLTFPDFDRIRIAIERKLRQKNKKIKEDPDHREENPRAVEVVGTGLEYFVVEKHACPDRGFRAGERRCRNV